MAFLMINEKLPVCISVWCSIWFMSCKTMLYSLILMLIHFTAYSIDGIINRSFSCILFLDNIEEATFRRYVLRQLLSIEFTIIISMKCNKLLAMSFVDVLRFQYIVASVLGVGKPVFVEHYQKRSLEILDTAAMDNYSQLTQLPMVSFSCIVFTLLISSLSKSVEQKHIDLDKWVNVIQLNDNKRIH